jgi:hypothetical protein
MLARYEMASMVVPNWHMVRERVSRYPVGHPLSPARAWEESAAVVTHSTHRTDITTNSNIIIDVQAPWRFLSMIKHVGIMRIVIAPVARAMEPYVYIMTVKSSNSSWVK